MNVPLFNDNDANRMKIYQPRINPPVFSFNPSVNMVSDGDESEVKIWCGSKNNVSEI